MSKRSKSTLSLTHRPSDTRGHADLGWLKTYHTFSFEDYKDSKYDGMGLLTVVNEDRVQPNKGFGTHSHKEFEIFSYVVSGELEHKDSLGHKEVIRKGEVQMTSAGTGISHSESNQGKKAVHFLQVWVQPTTPSLSPTYYSRAFPASAKLNTPCLIVAPADDPAVTPTRTGAPPGERPAATPAPVHAAFCAHACVQAPGTTLSFTLKGMTRLAYLHLCMRGGYRAPGEPALARDKSGVLRVEVGGGGGECVADEGDGVFVRVGKGGGGRKLRVTNEGGKEAEWVVMEVE